MSANPAQALAGLRNRAAQEEGEEQWLASYAMKSRRTRGRQHEETEDPFRTVYQRDHDRIVHSTAFRRLEYKTQVFVNHEGDYYRTRLTHTLEVAQIATSIARLLRLNEDLVRTVALAHDIGHPPFGHAGEDALRALMEGFGGFDHNVQGLRVVDLLEARYPGFPGLNLTWEVRESMNKHRTPYDHPDMQVALDPSVSPLLESQVVDIADEIAYDNHDLDDGLTSGILHEEDVEALELWRTTRESLGAAVETMPAEIRKYQMIRRLISRQVTDLAEETCRRIAEQGIATVDDVRHCREHLVGFSRSMQALRAPLKRLLWTSLYQHTRVVRMANKARRILSDLFHVYLNQPDQLPKTTRGRIVSGEEPHRVVCDYLAGMTDRYCLEEYKKLFDPFERV
ncbi:MAG TPA: deoxyguanosinetriphosphate triphosphohydrolase [bacterium]